MIKSILNVTLMLHDSLSFLSSLASRLDVKN